MAIKYQVPPYDTLWREIEYHHFPIVRSHADAMRERCVYMNEGRVGYVSE
jgi:hypothetical protein